MLDLCEGKVVKYLPLAEATARFAAGMSKVFVYNPTADVFQRWSLETFEKEATVKNLIGGTPVCLLMGHSTDGPLYVGGNKVNAGGYALLHPTTFKAVDLKVEGGGGFGGSGPAITDWYPPVVRVSGDGRVYGWHSVGLSPAGFNSMVISGKSAKCYHGHTTVSPIVPGPDGTLFTGGGLYTPEQKTVGDPNKPRGGVPATSGRWFLRLVPRDAVPGQPLRVKPSDGVAVELVDSPEIDLAVPESGTVFQLGGGMERMRHDFGPMDRLVLNPQAGVLAVLNDAGDIVHLLPVDLKAMLAKSDKDYLMVMSQPPAATRGQKWTYTPDVWSKTGKAVVKVETGPSGMTATGGTVTWTVPRDFAEGEAQVSLTVTDGGKQETFHTFALPVGPAK